MWTSALTYEAVTLIFELKLRSRWINVPANYLGQKSLSLEIIFQTYRHTHSGPIALHGPLKWSLNRKDSYTARRYFTENNVVRIRAAVSCDAKIALDTGWWTDSARHEFRSHISNRSLYSHLILLHQRSLYVFDSSVKLLTVQLYTAWFYCWHSRPYTKFLRLSQSSLFSGAC